MQLKECIGIEAGVPARKSISKLYSARYRSRQPMLYA